MAFQGSLQDIALPDILQLVAAQGMKGVLTLTRGGERLHILVSGGQAIGADSNQRPLSQRLATTLVKAGRLSRDDLRRALEVEQRGTDRLGKVLVDLGLVPAAIVRRSLTVHYQQMIYDVLRWKDGDYDFERRDVAASDEVEDIGFQGLLMNGMQMIDEWPMVESRLPNRGAIVHRATPANGAPQAEAIDDPLGTADLGPAPGPELTELQGEVLAQVDGQSTIQAIIDRSMQLEFDVCRALYDLTEQGLITLAFDGSLAELGLPELMCAIRSAAGTGQLELRSDDGLVSIWFAGGDLVDACSTDADEALGAYLLQSGTIGRAALEAAMTAARADQVGEWLVQHGYLTREALDNGRREHITDLIVSRFPERRGSYRFIPGHTSPSASDALARLTPTITMKGIRAVRRWSRLAAAVGVPSTTYRHNPSGASPAWGGALLADLQRVLSLFTDGPSVETALVKAHIPDHALYQILWWGRTLGLLDGGPTSTSRAFQQLVSALLGSEQLSSPSTDIEELFTTFRPPQAEAPARAVPEKLTTAPAVGGTDVAEPGADDVDFSDLLLPPEPIVRKPPAQDSLGIDALDLDVDALGDLTDLAPDESPPRPPTNPAPRRPKPRAG